MALTKLTKSDYLLFLKHPAWLWLKKNDPGKLPPPSENDQARMLAGTRLEPLAELLFVGQDAEFQAHFEAGGLYCKPDILVHTAPKTVKLIEIKSSTQVKPEHIPDLAFQACVLEAAGYTVESASVLHINNGYVRKGQVNPKGLFMIEDVTGRVKARQVAVLSDIPRALEVMALPNCPDISPRFCGRACECGADVIKDWLEIFRAINNPPPYSIYDLGAPSAKLLGQLEDLGIGRLRDIPDTVKLTAKQQRQVQAVKTGQRLINLEAISAFLSGLSYPLYFLDYETFREDIPPFDGMKPYQQVPCQYSLHVLDAPGAEPIHKEYLHTTPDLPAAAITARLKADIGPEGTVLAWYACFEKGCNNTLAELLPAEAAFFADVNARVQDLMQPFADGHFVDQQFLGSASIKKVLPVLCSEMSYSHLDVKEGQTAQRLWMEAVIYGQGTEAEKAKLFADLLVYCGQDTLAMVKIYQALLEVCGLVPLPVPPAVQEETVLG